MKILAVSDQVVENLYSPEVGQRFGDIDLILGCGDLPDYYLEFLVSTLNVPLYYVHGNHDQTFGDSSAGTRKFRARGCELLDSRVAEVGGLLLAGLEGSIWYNNEDEFQFSQAEMRWKAAKLSLSLLSNRAFNGRWLDIMVTHSPPFEVGDGRDRAHIGFHVFNTMIKRFKPRYLLHGHMHLYQGQKPGIRVGSTEVINVYPYRVIEW